MRPDSYPTIFSLLQSNADTFKYPIPSLSMLALKMQAQKKKDKDGEEERGGGEGEGKDRVMAFSVKYMDNTYHCEIAAEKMATIQELKRELCNQIADLDGEDYSILWYNPEFEEVRIVSLSIYIRISLVILIYPYPLPGNRCYNGFIEENPFPK